MAETRTYICLFSSLCYGTWHVYGSKPKKLPAQQQLRNLRQQPILQQLSGSSDAMHLSFYYPVNVGGDAAKLIEKICAQTLTLRTLDIVVDPGLYQTTMIPLQKFRLVIQGGTLQMYLQALLPRDSPWFPPAWQCH